MPMTRLPRQFLTSWVNHPRPHGRPQYTYGHSLTKSLKRTGIPPVFKEWSQLAQDRSNWRNLFYSKAEFPPTRQNWSFCSHFCMYFSHFRTSESIDVQSSAMQTHLHSKLLVIWIYLEGYLIIIIIIEICQLKFSVFSMSHSISHAVWFVSSSVGPPIIIIMIRCFSR